MPKSLNEYRDKEKALHYRNHQRSGNYNRGDFSASALIKADDYTLAACVAILDHKIPDREIAKMLRRSVRGIQNKRWKLKKTGGES